MKKPRKVFIGWGWVASAVDMIVKDITENWLVQNHPKCIVGLPRGGLIPAVILSHRLRLPLYPPNGIPHRYGKDEVLIVDDICDSGETLKRWVDEGYKTAVLHYKENTLDVRVDCYAKLAKPTKWIVYPWENPEAEAVPGYKETKTTT